MSALPPKADIIPHCIKCPLIAKSGHSSSRLYEQEQRTHIANVGLEICSSRWLARPSISRLRSLKLHSGIFPRHRIAKCLIVRFPPSIGKLLAAAMDRPLWSALIHPLSEDGVGLLVNASVSQEEHHRRIRNATRLRQSTDRCAVLVQPDYFMRIIRQEPHRLGPVHN